MTKILCLLTGIFYLAAAVADDGPFTMEFEELAPGVWAGVRADGPRFPVMGNTTFVISEEGVVVYDGGGMPAMSELVIDKIRSLTDKPVTHVVTAIGTAIIILACFALARNSKMCSLSRMSSRVT